METKIASAHSRPAQSRRPTGPNLLAGRQIPAPRGSAHPLILGHAGRSRCEAGRDFLRDFFSRGFEILRKRLGNDDPEFLVILGNEDRLRMSGTSSLSASDNDRSR